MRAALLLPPRWWWCDRIAEYLVDSPLAHLDRIILLLLLYFIILLLLSDFHPFRPFIHHHPLQLLSYSHGTLDRHISQMPRRDDHGDTLFFFFVWLISGYNFFYLYSHILSQLNVLSCTRYGVIMVGHKVVTVMIIAMIKIFNQTYNGKVYFCAR